MSSMRRRRKRSLPANEGSRPSKQEAAIAEPTRMRSYERDGLTFDVIDAGPLDGPPVVLLHGFPQRATSWAKVAPLLGDAGFRTYAPDQRGYAPAARPRGRRAYKISELVDDV